MHAMAMTKVSSLRLFIILHNDDYFYYIQLEAGTIDFATHLFLDFFLFE